MKYISKTLLCAALAVPALTGCELDQYPEDSLPVEQSWQKFSDATSYDVGIKNRLRAVSGGAFAYVSEIQSDLFNARSGAASLNQTHQWSFTSTLFDGDVVWQGNYNVIANANNVINNIDKVVPTSEEEEATLKIYKGDAYFARAMALANMVTRYCKNYDPATAANDLGLSLLEVVDVNAKPARSSLEATYAFIKSDIAQARELLAGMPSAVDAPSLDAVNALDARISLQMKDYDNAISLSADLIAKYPLAQDAEEFAMMWMYDEGSEIIYQPTQTVDERVNAYSTIYISYDATQEGYNPYYLPTQGLLDLYESNDMRRNIYFEEGTVATNTTTDHGVFFNKYPGNPNLKQDANSTSELYNMTKVFRVAEFYLIAAEASYQKNGTDGGYLNALREARGATAMELSGDALWAQIKNEWIREMVGEGFRLDCLKRWGEGFTRMTPQTFTQPVLLVTPGNTDLSVSADNFKFIWEVPQNDRQANSNLQQNWPSGN